MNKSYFVCFESENYAQLRICSATARIYPRSDYFLFNYKTIKSMIHHLPSVSPEQLCVSAGARAPA